MRAAAGSAIGDDGAEMVLSIAGGTEVCCRFFARAKIVNGLEAEVESGKGVNGAEDGRDVVESAGSVEDGGNAEDAESADGHLLRFSAITTHIDSHNRHGLRDGTCLP